VVTAQRVRPSREETLVRHSAEEAREFAARALELARAHAELDLPPERIARGALEYALRRVREPVRSADELRALFSDAGFALARFDADDASLHVDRPAGPPDAASRRMQIVAIRGEGR
jgi:hypothetical protein